MSLFPDRPDGFVEWLSERKRPLRADDYASRQDYGLYVRDSLATLLREKRPRPKVDFIRAKATGCVERYNSTLGFLLDNGGEVAGRNIVLCLGVGNAPLPINLSTLSGEARERVIDNPWRLSWFARVGETDRVCILGSGLTMIDQVLALQARGFRGTINVLSRRGLVPHGHMPSPKPAAQFDPATLPVRMSELVDRLRKESRLAGDWRSVMDRLRPQTQEIWARLPAEERTRFLRHALPWWNIHRHRVAPDIYSRFQEMVARGQVTINAGFLVAVNAKGKALSVSYRPKGKREAEFVDADWLINCTGVERAGMSHSPLLSEMQRQGLIEADPHGLGITVDRKSKVPAEPGGADIYAVGALTAGRFWEITAVPDIRVQAAAVVNEIVCRKPGGPA